MNRRISPLHGFPATQEILHHDGTMSYAIEAKAITPGMAIVASTLASASTLLLGFSTIGAGLELYNLPLEIALPLGMAITWAASRPMDFLWKHLLKRKTRISMTLESFNVKGLVGWKHFDRTLPHKFAVIPHDKTREEQQKLDLRMRRDQAHGRFKARPQFYAESAHVVFEYVGQRYDVMTVYGQKDAIAIASRLKTCDGLLDGMANRGDGIALDPSDQWGTDEDI